MNKLSIPFLLLASALLFLMACNKEEQGNPLVGRYIGESTTHSWGFEEIYDNNSNEPIVIDILVTGDTTFSQPDTLIIEKDIDDNHFIIKGGGALSALNFLSEQSFTYDKQTAFETTFGSAGSCVFRVNLLFDGAGNVTVTRFNNKTYFGIPPSGSSTSFSGVKE